MVKAKSAVTYGSIHSALHRQLKVCFDIKPFWKKTQTKQNKAYRSEICHKGSAYSTSGDIIWWKWLRKDVYIRITVNIQAIHR